MWNFIKNYPVVVGLIFALMLSLMYAILFWIEQGKISRKKHKRLDLSGRRVK